MRSNELGLLPLGCMLFDEVGEEEHLENGEDDEQLDEDEGPQRLAQLHVSEAVVIEVKTLYRNPCLFIVVSKNDANLQFFSKKTA